MTSLGLPDVNVLVALTSPAHVFHVESHRWLATVDRYATTPVTESGLLRLLLNRQVMGQEIAPQQALAVLTGIRSDPRAEFVPDDSSLADPAIELAGLAGHRQVADLHLLNLAVRHDAHLITFDHRLPRSLVPPDDARVVTLGG